MTNTIHIDQPTTDRPTVWPTEHSSNLQMDTRGYREGTLSITILRVSQVTVAGSFTLSSSCSNAITSGLLCIQTTLNTSFCSSLAAWKSASTLRLLWLQSHLLNLADKPDLFSPITISLFYKKIQVNPKDLLYMRTMGRCPKEFQEIGLL